MRKIKVLHTITRLILGGAQENTLLTVRGLHEDPNFDVTLLTGPGIGPEGEIVSAAREQGIKIIEIPESRRNINPYYDLITILKTVHFIRKGKYDVVHTHSTKAGIIGRILADRYKVPAIVHTIHGPAFYPEQNYLVRKFYIGLERWAAKYADAIVCVADAMKEKYLAENIGRPDQYITIRSGMEVERFIKAGQNKKKRAELRQKYGIRDDEIVVGKIARLFNLKGHEYVIEAARSIVKRHKNVKFFFAGDGILRDEFENRIARYGLTKHFILAGLIPNTEIPEIISLMDIVVHTSLREGLARVLPQALLEEKPVVSFDVDGAREVIKNGETGYLVAPKDIKGLTRALLAAIEEPETAQKMARSGRIMVEREFDWHKMVDDLKELYIRILRTKGRI